MDVPPKCVNSGKLVKLTLKLAGRNVKLVTLIEGKQFYINTFSFDVSFTSFTFLPMSFTPSATSFTFLPISSPTVDCGLLMQVHACIQACLYTCVLTKGALLFFSSEAPLGFIYLHWGQPRGSSLVHLH